MMILIVLVVAIEINRSSSEIQQEWEIKIIKYNDKLILNLVPRNNIENNKIIHLLTTKEPYKLNILQSKISLINKGYI